MEERELRKKPKYVEILKKKYEETGHEGYMALMELHESLGGWPIGEEQKHTLRQKISELSEVIDHIPPEVLDELRRTIVENRDVGRTPPQEASAAVMRAEELLEKLHEALVIARRIKEQKEMLKKGQPVM